MNQSNSGNFDIRNGASEDSFEALIRAARAGDENAVGALIERYRNYLLVIATDHVDEILRTKLAASDAVQESIMHAQGNFEQFVGESEPEFKVWIRTILANDIRKGRRRYSTKKRDANREINIQDKSAVGRGLLDEQLTPSSEAIQLEKEKLMRVALSRLSDDQQHVIQLRNFEELDFEAIGRQMNRSSEAARKLWGRAIEALKQSLKLVSPESLDQTQ